MAQLVYTCIRITTHHNHYGIRTRVNQRPTFPTSRVTCAGAAGVVVAAFQQLAPTLVGKQVALVICGGNVSTATLRQALSMSNVDSA